MGLGDNWCGSRQRHVVNERLVTNMNEIGSFVRDRPNITFASFR